MAVSSSYFIEGTHVPVRDSADIVVAGGGSAGFAAALAGARAGVKTIVLEREYALGGIMTLGLMAKVAIEPYMEGIPYEVINRLGSESMALPTTGYPGINQVTGMSEVPVDPEAAKRVLEELILEAGGTILYGALVVDVVKEEDTIRGVVVETKSGREIIEARVFIDATGDGDLSACAGADCRIGNEEDGMCSAPTLMFRIGGVDMQALLSFLDEHPGNLKGISPEQIRESVFGKTPKYAHIGRFRETIDNVLATAEMGDWERQVLTVRDGILLMNLPDPAQVLVNTSRILESNMIEAEAVSNAMIEGRRQCWFIYRFLKKYIGGFEDSHILDTASILGIRETRRITGDHIHTIEDVRARRKYDDAILMNTDSVEYHNPKGVGTRMERYNEGEYEEISYRSILVKGLTNLMVVGRCFSTDQLALSCNRSIGFCFSIGQAAGTAAAMSVNDDVAIREVSVEKLQQKVYPHKRVEV